MMVRWNGEKRCDAAAFSISPAGVSGLFREIKYSGGEDRLCEGCMGGKRLPVEKADDDGDGMLNEDRLDGEDNDGDGRVDEDFAAVGDRMVVAAASGEVPETLILNRCYIWAYQHVSEIAAFSTLTERGVPAGEEKPLSLRLEFFDPEEECGARERMYTDVLEVPLNEGADTLSVPLVSNGSVIAGAVILSPACSKEAEAELEVEEGQLGRGSEREGEEGNWSICRRASIVIKIDTPEAGAAGETCWAAVFGKSEKQIERNIRLALTTFRGVETAEGMPVRWVVPARKVQPLELVSTQVMSWNEGKEDRAIALKLPLEMVGRGIKWIRLNGRKVVDYTMTGNSVLIKPSMEAGGRVEIEGQFSDGSLFRSSASLEEPAKGSEADENYMMLPESFVRLYPNPFVDNVNIDLRITRTEDLMCSRGNSVIGGRGSVKIYDVRGELVKTVSERDFMPPGSYAYQWDGTDRKEQKVAPGVYYCTLKIGERSRTKRIILLK